MWCYIAFFTCGFLIFRQLFAVQNTEAKITLKLPPEAQAQPEYSGPSILSHLRKALTLDNLGVVLLEDDRRDAKAIIRGQDHKEDDSVAQKFSRRKAREFVNLMKSLKCDEESKHLDDYVSNLLQGEGFTRVQHLPIALS